MKSTYLNSELVKKWKNLKTRDGKNSFYFEELRPAITGVLRNRVESGIRSGTLARYSRLIISLGHDANPSLILCGALMPQNIIVLFTAKNRTQLEKRLLPNLQKQNPGSSVQLVELDYCNHDENYRSMLHEFKGFAGQGETICDITGGKKITSGHLAIIARKLGFDICYLDSSEYMEKSAVPVPGNESLYIHKSTGDTLYEFTLKNERVLFINSLNNNKYIVFNYGYNGDFFNFKKISISKTVINTIRDNLEAEYLRIDHEIRMSRKCTASLDEISGIIRDMLIEPSLDRVLRESGNGRMKIIADPGISGIPWDVAFSREYGAEIPLCVKLNRDSFRMVPQNNESHGILLLLGSGRDIENFEQYKDDIIQLL